MFFRGAPSAHARLCTRRQVDVYPRGCGTHAPVGAGLNRPAMVTLDERGVLAAAAAAQPDAAAAGAVALRLARRGEGGRLTVWTYEVPLAGGDARVLEVEDDSSEEEAQAQEGCGAAAEEDASAAAGMHAAAHAATCSDACDAPPQQPQPHEAQQCDGDGGVAAAPPALRLTAAGLRRSLDDVDD
jgi:hypothetical protein